jgi:hypothetical protein
MSKDFLGEAWLPPLSTFGRRSKDLVLPLKPACYHEDADNGPSRPADKITTDNAQELAKKDPNKKVTGDIYLSVAWKYPAYEVDEENAGESAHDRALAQERLHTGKLTIKIEQAKNLRRSDALKGRDCDPVVHVWLRNDVLMRWRKKPMVRTKPVSNNRNPKWNFVKEDIPLLAGEFEAKLPHVEESLFATVMQTFQTKRQVDRKQAIRDMHANKRFGNEGLRVAFSDHAKVSGAPAHPGENHGVDVFFGDCIFEFKKKLQQACANECVYWAKKAGEADARAVAYSDISISSKTLVMVFVPSAKVQKLFQQGLHESQEYQIAYEQAKADPSSWQPLDPARSFSQYPQFGFGRPQAQQLRVVESNATYRLYNLRYKEFARDMNKKGYEDTDTQTEAFGWAKYVHMHDSDGKGPTIEWRPCIASAAPSGTQHERPAYHLSADSAENLNFSIRWCFPVTKSNVAVGVPSASPAAAGDVKEIRDKQYVLLKPRCPQFDKSVHPLHVDLLDQAKNLRVGGKSDFEIAQMLDRLLQEQWEQTRHEQEDETRPPPITVDVVKAYFMSNELEAVIGKPVQ